jgi:DNA-binding NarL/FixJ family response regulator
MDVPASVRNAKSWLAARRREKLILEGIRAGKSGVAIAAELGLHPNSIYRAVARMQKRLKFHEAMGHK